MKIIIACDSFKGSLSSIEVGNAARSGILTAMPNAEVLVMPIGDGGESTVPAIMSCLKGREVSCTVSGPLGDPARAVYGVSEDGHTAVMEMAQASGLTLIPAERRNPLLTNTAGTGQMVADALSRGCRNIIIGIGGSATNDGGMGILDALGIRFMDSDGARLRPCGASLERIATIDASGLMPEAREATFNIACDVDNPLVGPRGSAFVFAPQKGADAIMVERLDQGMRNYARIVKDVTGTDVADMPGAGAAGGLGAAFAAFLNATLESGIDLILRVTGFEDAVHNADLVITGEGKLDAQTLMGKAPLGVLRVASKHNVPVVAIGGAVSEAESLTKAGFAAVLPIVAGPVSLDKAMERKTASENVTRTAEQIVRLVGLSLPKCS